MKKCTDNPLLKTAFPPIPMWSEFELVFARTAVAALPRRKVYVEIGGFRGGMLYTMREAMEPGATMISVDYPDGYGGGGKSANESLRKTCQLMQEQGFDASILLGKSQESATVKRLADRLAGRKIDVLVIDAGHWQGEALRDWQLYSPMLDGVSIWHDCGVQNHQDMGHPAAVEFMRHTRSGFDSAAFGHRFATIQEDYGTGLIWHQTSSS